MRLLLYSSERSNTRAFAAPEWLERLQPHRRATHSSTVLVNLGNLSLITISALQTESGARLNPALSAHVVQQPGGFAPVNVTGQKAIAPLAKKNKFTEKIESARAVVFLLDDRGKAAGQYVRWMMDGTRAGTRWNPIDQ